MVLNDFANAIGLVHSWPLETSQKSEVTIAVLVKWARTYYDAAELLYLAEHSYEPDFYIGPVIQTVGLATELTLKAMLRGGGKSAETMKKYGHNTYKAYFDSRSQFDEVKFITLHFSSTAHLTVPKVVRKRLTERGETDIEHRWRVYFDHLRALDSVYDRPFLTRYVKPATGVLPEAEIILIGTKLLLKSMEERLTAR